MREQLVDLSISEYGGADTITHLCELESQGFIKFVPGYIPTDCVRQILLDLGKLSNIIPNTGQIIQSKYNNMIMSEYMIRT